MPDVPSKVDFDVTSPEEIARHVEVSHVLSGNKAGAAAGTTWCAWWLLFGPCERQLQELNELCRHVDV